MFNDERINRVCARVYRTGILLAVLYTALYGVYHAVTAGIRGSLLVMEVIIILTGCVILLVGLFSGGLSRDERAEEQRHRYYLTAGKVFVVMALLGYAISISLQGVSGYPHNTLVSRLLTLGCVYFFYTFKRNEVSFNYTFIDEPPSAYYRHVLRNIGVLAAVLVIPFALSAMMALALYRSLAYFLAILLGYILSTVELGAYYLILSILEKLNEREEETEEKATCRGLLRKGTMIAFLFCIGAQTVDVLLEVAYRWVVTAFSLTQSRDVVMALSRATGDWTYLTLALVALAVSFLMEQYIHSKRVRIGVGGVLAVQAASRVLGTVDSTVVIALERSGSSHVISGYLNLLNYRGFLAWLLVMAFAGLLIYGLIRDKKKNKSSCCGGCAGCTMNCAARSNPPTDTHPSTEQE